MNRPEWHAIEKYARSRVFTTLSANPTLIGPVEALYQSKKTSNENPGVTYAKALTEAIPDWFTRYPKLLSSMLSNTASRQYLLANHGQKIPQEVLQSHAGVMIEYIRSVTEKDDSSLWTLVDAHWAMNWRVDVPDSVTVIEGLDRWHSEWMLKYPALVQAFFANPDTSQLIEDRLTQMQHEKILEFRQAVDTYVQGNASAIDDTAGVQEEQVWGGLLVQKQHLANLSKFRAMLTRYKGMTVNQKAAYLNRVSDAAGELFAARGFMSRMYRRATTRMKSNLYGKWAVSDNGYWLKEYQTLLKAGKHKEAAESRWGDYLRAREEYLKLLDKNPILTLKPDTFIGDTFLFDWVWNKKSSADSNAYVAAKFDEYLDANISNVDEEITKVTQIDDWDDLEEFGTPRYLRAQQQVMRRFNAVGFNEGSAWVSVLVGEQDVQATENVVYQVIAEGALATISVFATAGSFAFPVLAPVALAADFATVAFVGGETVVTLYNEENAEDFAAVTGHKYHFTQEDKLAAAQGKLVLTGLVFVPMGVQAFKNLRVVNKTRPRNPVVAGGGRAATSGDDAARVLSTADNAATSASTYKIAGASDDVNELAAAAAREGVPPSEIQAIVARYTDDVSAPLEPAVFNRLHNELTIAAANAKDLTIVVQKGTGGRLPGERYLFDLDELADMAGGTRPRNPVKETDLVLWQRINAKTATRPKKPGPNATPDELRAFEAEMKNWENGWTPEMVEYVEKGVLTRTDDELLRMWEYNPYESVGSKFFNPDSSAGLAKIFTSDDLTRIRALWSERPPTPHQVATTPRTGPGSGPGPGPSVTPPRPGMDLESTVPGRGPADVKPTPRVEFSPKPPAPAVRSGAQADTGTRSLLSVDEYDELLKRQSGGEILNLDEVPRPGIGNVIDGQIGVGQGAGRFEKLRAGDSMDIFVQEGVALPPGVTVIETGISAERAFAINMLSSRGAKGANPGFLKLLTEGKSFQRVLAPRSVLKAPTAKVGFDVSRLADDLRAWAGKRGPGDPLARRVEDLLDSKAFRDKSLVEQADDLRALKDVLEGNPLQPPTLPSSTPPPTPPPGGGAPASPAAAPKQPGTFDDLVKEALARSDARNMRDAVVGGESYVRMEQVAKHYKGDKAIGDVIEVGHVVDDHYLRNAGPGKLYGSSKVPPTHTTNRAGLQGVRNDPKGLTRDLGENASWSYEGTLRGGDVVIRLNKDGLKHVKMRPVTGINKGHGQVPEFYPQGLDAAGNGIGTALPNVPGKYLEYYNYIGDNWLPVAR